MKKEQLERANEIQTELAELNQHKDDLAKHMNEYKYCKEKKEKEPDCSSNNERLSLFAIGFGYPNSRNNEYSCHVPLRNDLLPVNFDTFTGMYYLKIKERIEALQTEFDSL